MEIEVTFCGEPEPRKIHIPDYGTTLGYDLIKPKAMYLANTSDRVLGLYCIDPTTCTEFEFLDWLEYGNISDLESFGKDSSRRFFSYRKRI